MNIKEVSEILGLCRFLRAPRHVFIAKEPVYEEWDSKVFFRGLQPKERRDVIFLSSQADASTVGHEAWHAMTGLGELTADPVGRLVALKYEIIRQFPRLKALLTRRVVYRRVSPEEEVEFPQVKRYRGRVEHYILVEE